MDREGLASFLRRRREGLQPEDVGLPPGLRRRTSGLRREELAQLAFISTDYLARLEQQRGPQPSVFVLEALARALRLGPDERDHLHRLADQPPPSGRQRSDLVPPGLQLLLTRMAAPAMVTNDLGEALEQNDLAVALLGDERRFRPDDPDRSRFHRWFTDPAERAFYTPEACEELSRSHVAALRLALGRHPDDERGLLLVDRLRARSEEFDALWARHDVSWRRAVEPRPILHPRLGRFELECRSVVIEHESQVLLVFTPAPQTATAAHRLFPAPEVHADPRRQFAPVIDHVGTASGAASIRSAEERRPV
jgi:transcriptional regulator with XRE-family HTH domain